MHPPEIETPSPLNRLFDYLFGDFFDNSLPIAVLALVFAFVVDLFVIHEFFARSGGIVVGYAILHSIEHKRLALALKVEQPHLDQANKFPALRSYRSIEDLRRDPKGEALGQKVMANWKFREQPRNQIFPVDYLGPKTPEDEEVGFTIVQAIIDGKERALGITAAIERTVRNERVLAVMGTLIWAFGDWFTNIIWHCPGHLTCGPGL